MLLGTVCRDEYFMIYEERESSLTIIHHSSSNTAFMKPVLDCSCYLPSIKPESLESCMSFIFSIFNPSSRSNRDLRISLTTEMITTPAFAWPCLTSFVFLIIGFDAAPIDGVDRAGCWQAAGMIGIERIWEASRS